MGRKSIFGFFFFSFFFLLSVEARVKYNSQVSPPYNIHLADLTGDGISEFYVVDNDKVYVTTSEFTVHGLSYNKLPATISRTINGKFTGGPKEVLCAQEPSLGRLDCYVMSASNNALVWWWYQGDFIGTRSVIVGDFNGDGYDDILCYTPSTGLFQMYRWNSATNFFEVMANWVPGNIGGGFLKNYQVRAGTFGTVDARTDLLFYNPANGQALVYVSVYDSSISKYTFWWWFTTKTGWGLTNEEILVADLNGDGTEEAILHNYVTGTYYTSTVKYNSATQGMTYLAINLGQIHQGANSRAFFAKLKNLAVEDGGKSNIRDDVIVFSYDWQLWVRSDARHDGTKQTYWWAYSQYPIRLNLDQDGDAILTKHELGGYDPNNDGVSNVPLHTYGSSPFYKDIYVEADYMQGPPGATWDYSMYPAAVSLASSTLAGKSINLHIFVGNSVPYQANLGSPGFDWATNFDPIKNANFAADRRYFFHYCLFANRYNGGSSSGLSRGIIASDFIVTLGSKGTTAQQVGTFLHELGHNLGLRHGGTDDTNNKPNHISIMNYNYQFIGINKAGTSQYLYSDIVCNALNENALNENTGVTCATGGVAYQTYISSAAKWDIVNTNFDWNQNGALTTSVAVDTNNDGVKNILIASVNEFNYLVYGGGLIGDAVAKKRSVQAENETIIWEPPMEDIPTAPPSDTNTTASDRQLRSHFGVQYLASPVLFPDTIPDASHAFYADATADLANNARANAELVDGARDGASNPRILELEEPPVHSANARNASEGDESEEVEVIDNNDENSAVNSDLRVPVA